MAQTLVSLAKHDPNLVVCTPAMKDGTKLGLFAKLYPERFFDTGIAEEHTLVYAAGLAAAGMKPVVCIYSTFLQRAMDQVMHDICLPKLPVLLGIDRAGLVGEDGETHHGILDVSWLSAVPEMTIAAPRDAEDLEFFVKEWKKRSIPMAIRYPRGKADLSIKAVGAEERVQAPWGSVEVLREGEEVCLIGVGSTTRLMLDAANRLSETGVNATVVDLRFIKPLDLDGLLSVISRHRVVVTAEENALAGGTGEAIAAELKRRGIPAAVRTAGVPDKFISHATRTQQWEECGLTVDSIVELCSR